MQKLPPLILSRQESQVRLLPLPKRAGAGIRQNLAVGKGVGVGKAIVEEGGGGARGADFLGKGQQSPMPQIFFPANHLYVCKFIIKEATKLFWGPCVTELMKMDHPKYIPGRWRHEDDMKMVLLTSNVIKLFH